VTAAQLSAVLLSLAGFCLSIEIIFIKRRITRLEQRTHCIHCLHRRRRQP
jgi:hypothetical protein